MAWFTDIAEVRFGGKGQKAPDSSVLYMYDKKFYLYITEIASERVVLFHPYVKSMSINMDVETDKDNDSLFDDGGSYNLGKGTITYSVDLVVPAVDKDESIINSKRLNEFIKMLKVDYGTKDVIRSHQEGNIELNTKQISSQTPSEDNPDESEPEDDDEYAALQRQLQKANQAKFEEAAEEQVGGDQEATGVAQRSTLKIAAKKFGVSFHSLIQGGKWTKFKYIGANLGSKQKTIDSILKYGIIGYVTSISVDTIVDSGFFEDGNGILYAKEYSLKFDIVASNEQYPSTQYNIVGFSRGDNYKSGYHKKDIKTWPFGITSKLYNNIKSKLGSDYTRSYLRGKGLGNQLRFSNCLDNCPDGVKHTVKFKPFLDSLSLKREIPNDRILKIDSQVGTNRITYTDVLPTYNLSFTIVSNSENESIANLYSLQKLSRMIFARASNSSQVKPVLYVSLGNLISEGGEFSRSKKPMECVCKKIDLSPDMEMGFFEHNDGLLLPKLFKIKLQLEVTDLTFT